MSNFVSHHRFKKRNPASSYPTPQKLFDQLDSEFHFVLDAAADACNAKCAKYYTIEDNALQQDWGPGPVFLNPPFNGLWPWVEKSYQESLKGVTVVVLMPVRSETAYWHQFVIPYGEVRYLKKVIFHGFTQAANFPCAVVIFRRNHVPKTREFFQAQGKIGGLLGGRKTAANMTAQQRRERAQRAARARWSK